MKVVLAGGSGQLGRILARSFHAEGHEVVVLSRSPTSTARSVAWDGATLGPWAKEFDGADAVVNLAGRSVNCRYTEANLQAMADSRVRSTRVVGEAIASARRPPPVWLQMSTATLYAHRFDADNDESGPLGGAEPGVPAYWARSIAIGKAWEQALAEAATPATRRVALRSAMVMSPDPGGVYHTLLGLARLGLGGTAAGGGQWVSWIHEADFVAAITLLLDSALEGVVNVAAPYPLPQVDQARILRETAGVPFGLPASRWMLELGAFLLRTDTELVLKSRRVVPGRLLAAGMKFRYPTWGEAARELAARV
jgi:uncharacterized protein (TIGR01777 family)